ncbi:MAG: type II toxin-antitoxin system VapC family toxin [Deltaproteobacteria bacterium]|nr:type II toxin-antitoxin system VapC family toxin [Deltaproteobacteria bacterium]
MVVIDTHVWLWWSHDPSRLSPLARTSLFSEEKQGIILVSAISVWEIAVKLQLGKLALPMNIHAWYEKAAGYPGIRIEPVTPRDGIESTLLPGDFHKDPADRLIIALARRHGAPLVTRDQAIIDYPHVETIW